MDRVFLKPLPFDVPGRGGYPVESFLGEFVWTFEKWGTTDDWGDAQIRIGETIEATKEGAPVVLSIEDFDKLREAIRAAKIAGSFAFKLRKMARIIQGAKPVDSAEGKLMLATVEAKALPEASTNGAS